ncbi:MAG: hypothetical protein OEU93_05400 [Rubrivivax sp.]|nr:hypothetical protein [Rubrivivax sp.]
MYDSLIAKIAAATLAGFVSLAMLAGVDSLAVQEHAATTLAKGKTSPAMLAAAASAPAETRL